jgi:predicted O-methyltransferase YrrM
VRRPRLGIRTRVRLRARVRIPRRTDPRRSRAFRAQEHNRFWWHRLDATDYVPPIYAALSEREWAVLEGWYADTARFRSRIAEINVPAMSFVVGLVGGNGIRRIVQLGHSYGYSSLVLGFALRAMDATPGLVSFDIDPIATRFTKRWIGGAGLDSYVTTVEGDSGSPASVQRAEAVLGGPPELILVDSSHAYAHTVAELDLWTPRLAPGGIVLLHDAAPFAADFDPTRAGGVRRALTEWLPRHPEITGMLLNGDIGHGADGDALVYKDACGLGVLQKRFNS